MIFSIEDEVRGGEERVVTIHPITPPPPESNPLVGLLKAAGFPTTFIGRAPMKRTPRKGPDGLPRQFTVCPACVVRVGERTRVWNVIICPREEFVLCLPTRPMGPEFLPLVWCAGEGIDVPDVVRWCLPCLPPDGPWLKMDALREMETIERMQAITYPSQAWVSGFLERITYPQRLGVRTRESGLHRLPYPTNAYEQNRLMMTHTLLTLGALQVPWDLTMDDGLEAIRSLAEVWAERQREAGEEREEREEA